MEETNKQPAPLKPLVINRELWSRGEDDSYLLRKSDGKRCCLGFLSSSCGIPDEYLINEPLPDHVEQRMRENGDRFPVEMKFLVDGSCASGQTSTLNRFVFLNDSTGSAMPSEEQRERELTELFAKHGWAVEFIN